MCHIYFLHIYSVSLSLNVFGKEGGSFRFLGGAVHPAAAPQALKPVAIFSNPFLPSNYSERQAGAEQRIKITHTEVTHD